jgi:hypothetical protein
MRSSIVSHVLVDAIRAVNNPERNPRLAGQKHSELHTVYFQKGEDRMCERTWSWCFKVSVAGPFQFRRFASIRIASESV